MRTLALGTKILSACALAVGLVVSLGLPWYGHAEATVAPDPSVGELHSSLREVFGGVGRWFGERAGITGWEAMSQLDVVLVCLAALAVASALACWFGALEHTARDALRAVSVAMAAVVIVRLVDQPGDNALLEPRYGGFVALSCACGLMIVASNISAAKLRRRPAALQPQRSARALS